MTRKITVSLILATALFTISAYAQQDVWTRNISSQLISSIESDDPEVRGLALQQLIYFANYNPEIDLTSTVPALVRVYKKDSDDRYRIMAAVGLHAIGDESGMQKVRSSLTRQRNRIVQLVSFAAVRDYFGADTFKESKEVAEMAERLLATM